MTEKITAIVIDITRHNDKLNIVTLFTRSRGRISFLSPAGSGKMGRLRHSRLQPLAAIEADINFRQTAELQRLGTFALYTVWNNLYFDPVKRLVALFISEFLNKLLRATMPDEALWDFILNSISLLDNLPGVSPISISHSSHRYSHLPGYSLTTRNIERATCLTCNQAHSHPTVR